LILFEIDDYAAPSAFPPRHKKPRSDGVAASLKRAIRCFISPVRRARAGPGQEAQFGCCPRHRFVDVQTHVVRLVRDEVVALQRRVEFGDGSRKPQCGTNCGSFGKRSSCPCRSARRRGRACANVGAGLTRSFTARRRVCHLPINGFAKEAPTTRSTRPKGAM